MLRLFENPSVNIGVMEVEQPSAGKLGWEGSDGEERKELGEDGE